MCIATATDRHLVEPAVRRTGLDNYFDRIFPCYEYGGKDRPDIFMSALSYLGTPLPDTYVFEDSLFAIKTAREAGFPIVGIHDRFSDYQTDEIKKMSDIYVYGYDELIKLFGK